MKSRKYMVAVLLFFFMTGQVYAYDTMKENTEGWLQSSSSASGSRPGITTTDAPIDPAIPVGSGLYILLVGSLAYAGWAYRKKQKQ
ncbi:MAG: hypothetical protein LBI82_02140 [Dysgonamonadaceae bacterium]|nr:hypothetical protein [Dysgonamonadaceae bacterium]